ncbi:10347_t:CDS:2, partial [Funneliformis mosseae]
LKKALSCIPPPITYSLKCTLTGPDCVYSRRPTDATGIPDFNCHRAELLILVMEAKRKYVLEDMGEQTLLEFYYTGKGKDHTELWISKTLPLQSESPPVLKAYAYLTRQAKENPNSSHPQVLVPVHGDNNSRVLRSHIKSPSNSSINQQPTPSNQLSSSAFGASSNTFVKQNNYSFSDFKFKSILGEGRSGKTLLCEFRGDMIALKSADLSKIPSWSVMDIMEEQKTRAIKGLKAIHKHGILHNDIQEENILINDNDDIYLIDFGMASRADTKKKRKLFEEEQLKLSQLLDGYIVQFVKKEGRISKSRKCQ